MSNSSNGNSGKASGGIGFFGVLQLILITLKLCKVITWSWWLVLLPIWIGVGLTAILIVIIVIATILTQEQMRNLNTIVETYGNDAQEDMAIEECSELVKAILKLRRSDEKTAEMREAVIDEIADVQIMLSQLEIIFNCVAEVEDRIDFKINRQMGRIKEREAKRDVC